MRVFVRSIIGYGGCGVEKHTLKINTHDLIKVTRAEVGDFTK